MKNIEFLAIILEDLIAKFPDARIFWVTHHTRPPDLSDFRTKTGRDFHAYSWQTHDIINSLEIMAISRLTSVGVKSIDLRHVAMGAPASWWDDQVHYGASQNSLFKHMSMQILLHHLCQ